MSSFSSACKTIHVSPSLREHTCDSAGQMLSQGGCLARDQGQMLGAELGLIEMSEVEYTHLQYLYQADMEAQAAPQDGPDARSPTATVMDKDTTVISPITAAQAIDLSTSTDGHCVVMPGEKTPASYGEVPSFVLARLRGETSPAEPRSNSSTSLQKRSRSAVCLEKRFNSMSADPAGQQDTVHNSFLTILQQSAEAREAVVHPKMQKWMKTDRANPFEVSSPFVGDVFNPVTNMCEQVIGHFPRMVEPKHQGLIIPKDDVATPAAASRKLGRTHSSRPIQAAKAAPDAAGKSESSSRKRAPSQMSLSQRRERHNSKERERRKRIRSCCDELNTLVPFCGSDTDKVTTLQWTTAFLRYIDETYGDTFKEEFQKGFIDEKELFLKTSSSSGQDSVHREKYETEHSSLLSAVEQ